MADPWDGIGRFTYMNGSFFWVFHVGKYSVRPMDAMGNIMGW